MNNKLPETSIDAFQALTPAKLAKDYKDITDALKRLESGTYEEISLSLGWKDINKCSRRLKELEDMGRIYKKGDKKLTSRNRQAFVYRLAENGEVSTQPEKLMSGKSVGDWAKELIQQTLF